MAAVLCLLCIVTVLPGTGVHCDSCACDGRVNLLVAVFPSFRCRKSIHLLKYVLEEFPTDKKVAVEGGAVEKIQSLLASPELDVRLGAIDVLVVLSPEVVKLESKKKELEGMVDTRIGECDRVRLSGDSDTQADMVEEIDALRKLKSSLFEASVARAEEQNAPPPLLLGAPPR